MPYVVQVDVWQPGRRGEPLKPPCNRVGVGRPAVRPAEQHAVIVIVRPEVPPLLVELLDVCLEGGQGERVKAAPPRGAAGPASAPGSAVERPAWRTPGHTAWRTDQRWLVQGVIAIAYGPSPTPIGCPGVLVAVAIGTTVPGSPQTPT